MKIKNITSYILFFSILIFFLANYCKAEIILKHFASFNSVNGIVKIGDNLYLATSGGLVKFNINSKAIKTYTDIFDLPDLNLVSLAIDERQNIWLASGKGYITNFNPQTESFTSYNAIFSSGWNINCIKYFKNHLLIGTNKGLSVFSLQKLFFENANKFNSFNNSYVSDIYIFGDTVCVLTPNGIAFTVIQDINSVIFSDPSIWTCINQPNAIGIIKTSESIIASNFKIFQLGNDIWKFGSPDSPNSLFLNDQLIYNFPSAVNCFFPLNNSFFTIGTQNSFFYLCDINTKNFSQITINGLCNTNINSCIVDHNGILWIVPQDITNGFGNFLFNTWFSVNSANTFGLGNMNQGPSPSYNNITVTTKNDIWISTFGYGVKWLNRESNTWQSYEDSAAPGNTIVTPITRFDNQISNGIVLTWWSLISGICEDSSGNIWIANMRAYNGKILHIRKPKDNSVWKTFNIKNGDLNLISDYTSYLASNYNAKTNQNYIYLGYTKREDKVGGGLSIIRYNRSDDPFSPSTPIYAEHYTEGVSVKQIAIANDTLVWFCADDGIYKITNNTTMSIKKISSIIASEPFYAITTTPDGKPVFFKDNDIYVYNEADSSLTNLTKTKNIFGPITNIYYDKVKNTFWICGEYGLYKLENGINYASSQLQISKVDVFPNPVSRNYFLSGHFVRFTGLSYKDARVIIYDASGNMVNILQEKNSSIINWDGTNKSGKPIIPGSYFFTTKSSDSKKIQGKIFVIP
jgi:streptogramin lyase